MSCGVFQKLPKIAKEDVMDVSKDFHSDLPFGTLSFCHLNSDTRRDREILVVQLKHLQILLILSKSRCNSVVTDSEISA